MGEPPYGGAADLEPFGNPASLMFRVWFGGYRKRSLDYFRAGTPSYYTRRSLARLLYIPAGTSPLTSRTTHSRSPALLQCVEECHTG
jgi:hypothetical protein